VCLSRALASALVALQQDTEHTVIQWGPSHRSIHGNEEADFLAEIGGHMSQEMQEVTYEEVKTIVKEKQQRRWLQQHPDFNSKDGYYLLPKEEQAIIVRLGTEGQACLDH